MPHAVVCLLPLRSACRKTRMPAVVAIVNATRNSAVDRLAHDGDRVRAAAPATSVYGASCAAVHVGVRGPRQLRRLVALASTSNSGLELRRLDAEAGAERLRELGERSPASRPAGGGPVPAPRRGSAGRSRARAASTPTPASPFASVGHAGGLDLRDHPVGLVDRAAEEGDELRAHLRQVGLGVRRVREDGARVREVVEPGA